MKSAIQDILYVLTGIAALLFAGLIIRNPPPDWFIYLFVFAVITHRWKMMYDERKDRDGT